MQNKKIVNVSGQSKVGPCRIKCLRMNRMRPLYSVSSSNSFSPVKDRSLVVIRQSR